MTRSIVWRLIAKDLYLYRWLVAGTVVVGLGSLLMSGSAGATGIIGRILFVTTVVVLGVFLAMYGLIADRQSRSMLFGLSLPISPLQYVVAKVSASLIAFLVPWLVFTATIVVFAVTKNPPATGGLPWVAGMMGLFLANFCVLIAIGVITGSEMWAVIGIIATNTSVPVVLSTVLPAVTNPNAPAAAWNGAIMTMLGVEAAVVVLSLALAFQVQARKKDYIR